MIVARWETLLPTVRDLLNSFSRICCLSLIMIFAAVPAIGRSPASQSRDQAGYAISSFRATPFQRCGTRSRLSWVASWFVHGWNRIVHAILLSLSVVARVFVAGGRCEKPTTDADQRDCGL